jgi:hypothetical protein
MAGQRESGLVCDQQRAKLGFGVVLVVLVFMHRRVALQNDADASRSRVL